MARYGPNLNKKIEQLERNFSVSSIVFEKYSAIFKQVFKTDHIETIKRGRKYVYTTIYLEKCFDNHYLLTLFV